MKKIKILHISEALGRGGGVYNYINDLTQFLSEDNEVELGLIYSDSSGKVDPATLQSDFKGVELRNVKMVRELSPLTDFRSVIELQKTIQEFNPDVIHLHSSKMTVLGRLAKYFAQNKAKLFYTPHGYSFLREDISPLKQKLYYQIEKQFQKVFGGTTIACGDTEHEIAMKNGKSELVRNGVKIKEIRKYKSPMQNDTLLVGTVGRASFQKNPKLFNDIALLNPNVEFVWIGGGELEMELTSPNITITGWLKREEALQALNRLDVYLQTSLWEGLPLSVLEAMALEKPVIATNVIGNKDAVQNEKTGYLFNNPEEVSKILDKLKDSNFRSEMGQKGLERVEKRFDLEKNFEKLKAIYLSK